MKNALFVFVMALFVSACSSTPNPPPGGNDAAVNPNDTGADALVMPTDGTVVMDAGTDVVTPIDTGADVAMLVDSGPTDTGSPPSDVMDYPICPASLTDGTCQLADRQMSNVNLPPGQPFDPWLRDAMGNPTNRNMVPASGTERMFMAATGEHPDYFVPCWENLFNDDWGFVHLTGPQMGSSTTARIMARMVSGMYTFDSSFTRVSDTGFVWSVRGGQSLFFSNFGHIGVAGAYYCQGSMSSSCSQMNISCWSSPANPLTTPSPPPDITIRGRWGGDHVGP